MHNTPNDPRFVEVDEHLQRPSDEDAQLLGATGWVDPDPAFSYEGLRLRIGRKRPEGPQEEISERRLQAVNQFAKEMDHAAQGVVDDVRPHTPGEEGMQDITLMTALYEAMQNGRTVKLPPVDGKDVHRGPPPG